MAKNFGDFLLRGGGGYPLIPLRKIPLVKKYFGSKNSISLAFSHTFLAPFGLSNGLFGPFLTLFNTKTSFLVLLETKIPEKLNGLSGYPPFPQRVFCQNDFPLRGRKKIR